MKKFSFHHQVMKVDSSLLPTPYFQGRRQKDKGSDIPVSNLTTRMVPAEQDIQRLNRAFPLISITVSFLDYIRYLLKKPKLCSD